MPRANPPAAARAFGRWSSRFRHLAFALAACPPLLWAGCDLPPKRNQDGAHVTVGSPSVFTRERFVADRFAETDWLRRQLSDAAMQDYEQGWQGSLQSAVSAKVGIGAQYGKDATQAGQSGPSETLSQDELQKALLAAAERQTATPQDRLDDRLAFRDGVAAAIRQRSLDDTHDLDGSTLYELRFDLTLEANYDEGRPVLVLVTPRITESHCCADMFDAIVSALERMAVRDAMVLQERMRTRTLTTREYGLAQDAIERGLMANAVEHMLTVTKLAERGENCAKPQLEAAWCRATRDRDSLADDLVTGKQSPSCMRAELVGDRDDSVLSTLRRRVLGPLLDSETRRATNGADSAPGQTQAKSFSMTRTAPVLPIRFALPAFFGVPSSSEVPPDVAVQVETINKLPGLSREERDSLIFLCGVDDPAGSLAWAMRAIACAIARRYAAVGAGELLAASERQYITAPFVEVSESPPLRPVRRTPEACARIAAILAGEESNAKPKVRALGVTPAEQVEQLSLSTRSYVVRSLALAASGTMSTGAPAQANLNALREELKRYELIHRNPLVVGFIDGKGSEDGGASLGWLLGPPIESRQSQLPFMGAQLYHHHRSVHHPVSTILVVPGWAKSMEVSVHAYAMSATGALHSIPVGLTSSSRANSAITIPLPGDPEAVAAGLLAKSGKRFEAASPTIAVPPPGTPGGSPWELASGRPNGIVIQGLNLWRNPEVFVGGQRADRVRILPDMQGVYAEFDSVRMPPSDGASDARASLTVSTSAGTDTAFNAVRIVRGDDEALPRATLVRRAAVAAPNATTTTLHFRLDRPLPSAWSALVVILRRDGATGHAVPTELASGDIYFDSANGGLEVRKVNLGAAVDAKAVAVFDVALALRDSPQSTPRRLNAIGTSLYLFGADAVKADPHLPSEFAIKVRSADQRVIDAKSFDLTLAHVPSATFAASTGARPGGRVDCIVRIGGTEVPEADVYLNAPESATASKTSLKLHIRAEARLPAIGDVACEFRIGDLVVTSSTQLKVQQ